MFQSHDLAVAVHHCGLVEVGGSSCLSHQLLKRYIVQVILHSIHSYNAAYAEYL